MSILATTRDYRYGYSMEPNAVLRKVLERSPGSIRALAREAGLSHALLILVRDGEKRMTAETRRRVVDALRRWSASCRELADDLEEDGPLPEEEESDG